MPLGVVRCSDLREVRVELAKKTAVDKGIVDEVVRGCMQVGVRDGYVWLYPPFFF